MHEDIFWLEVAMHDPILLKADHDGRYNLLKLALSLFFLSDVSGRRNHMKTGLLKVTKKESFAISFFFPWFLRPVQGRYWLPRVSKNVSLVALSCILIIKFSYKLKQIS